jgi:hypothetical protein
MCECSTTSERDVVLNVRQTKRLVITLLEKLHDLRLLLYFIKLIGDRTSGLGHSLGNA